MTQPRSGHRGRTLVWSLLPVPFLAILADANPFHQPAYVVWIGALTVEGLVIAVAQLLDADGPRGWWAGGFIVVVAVLVLAADGLVFVNRDRPPAAPVSLTVLASVDRVELTWPDSADDAKVVAYQLRRSENGNSILIMTDKVTRFTDASVTGGATYIYTLVALADSELVSSAVTATVQVPILSATIQPPVLSAVVESDHQVRLSWPDSSPYVVSIFRDGSQLTETAESGYVDNGLNPDTEYRYTARATDVAAHEQSPESAAVLVRTLPLAAGPGGPGPGGGTQPTPTPTPTTSTANWLEITPTTGGAHTVFTVTGHATYTAEDPGRTVTFEWNIDGTWYDSNSQVLINPDGHLSGVNDAPFRLTNAAAGTINIFRFDGVTDYYDFALVPGTYPICFHYYAGIPGFNVCRSIVIS